MEDRFAWKMDEFKNRNPFSASSSLVHLPSGFSSLLHLPSSIALILWPQTSDLRPLSSHLPPPGRTAATKSAATTGKTAESTTPESAATHPETTAA